MNPVYLAIDIGAESGRVIAASLVDGSMTLMEVHRFANTPRYCDGHLRWDMTELWQQVDIGLSKGARRFGTAVRSIAVDTWGVDYGLIGADGQLLADPIHHRDARTQGLPERLADLVSDQEWWQRTGIRALDFNTAYQLLADGRERLQRADRILTIPDLITWKLSGLMTNEWTNASTSQLCMAGQGGWDHDLIARLGLPPHLFQPTTPSGQCIGPMQASVASQLGWRGSYRPQVVLCAAHDTASAVAAMPVVDGAYLSCGTWSLMGVVTDQPVLTESARLRRLSNELAWNGRTRLLKNIMGLWVVQECRRAFAAQGRDYDYPTLTRIAAQADDMAATLDVDDARLFPPGTLDDPYLARIQQWYQERGHAAPSSDGEIIRAVLRGLAQAYADTLRDLAAATGQAPSQVVLMGGGGRNAVLRDFTRQACGVELVQGASEATALGNALIQAVACGDCAADEIAVIAAASSAEPVVAGC